MTRVADPETGRHGEKARGVVRDRMAGWPDDRAADRRPEANGFSRLELHIGELVLQGFTAMDAELLGTAVQAELTRLLAAGGLPSRLAQAGPAATLDGGQFSPEIGEDVQSLGARIARAVYAG